MSHPTLRLLIGDKRWSSWSLRPWLILAHHGVPFAEDHAPLRRPDTAEIIKAKGSPSALVPVLFDSGQSPELVLPDSLAIAEYLAETMPELRLWPEDRVARAKARAAVCEMHGGFTALRSTMPMDWCARVEGHSPTPECAANIARIIALWEDALGTYGKGGEGFLFGRFTIADAFFAPVVSRFTTYGVALTGAAAEYREHMWSLPAMQRWGVGAESEEAEAE